MDQANDQRVFRLARGAIVGFFSPDRSRPDENDHRKRPQCRAPTSGCGAVGTGGRRHDLAALTLRVRMMEGRQQFLSLRLALTRGMGSSVDGRLILEHIGQSGKAGLGTRRLGLWAVSVRGGEIGAAPCIAMND